MTSHRISNDRATVPQGAFLVRVQTIHLFLCCHATNAFQTAGFRTWGKQILFMLSLALAIYGIHIYIYMYFFCDVGKPSCFLWKPGDFLLIFPLFHQHLVGFSKQASSARETQKQVDAQLCKSSF